MRATAKASFGSKTDMSSFRPIEDQYRIRVVDALRGLALLGILVANIPIANNADEVNASSRIFLGTPGSDKWLEMLFHFFIDKKFITIFSILFGFGFYIQLKRAEEQHVAFRSYYFKRMLILLLIGCLHAYLIWFGDITRDYAICGIFLLMVYHWPVKRILILSFVFSVLLTGTVFILNGVLELQKYSYDPGIIWEMPVATSYQRYIAINATVDPFINFIQDSPITLVFAFGNMLLGFWMGKSGFFKRPVTFNPLRKKLIIVGILLGIPASYFFWLVTTGKIELSIPLLWLPYVIVAGMILQSLFYISAFVELWKYKIWYKLLRPFEKVGRMALTNYMLQTVFYLVVFFHWFPGGLHLYGKLSLTETYLLSLLLFAIQVVISHLWLNKFMQGPVEYLWKKLAYAGTK